MRATALVLFFGVLYSVDLGGTGVLDYDEACYAEVSRVLYEEGRWLEPTLGGEPFFEKPPFTYWTQIAGFHLFGVNALGARFFNMIAGVASVLLVYGLARRPLGARGAFIAAVVLGTSIELVVLSRVALTDAWLTLFLTASLGCFFVADERQRGGAAATAWLLASCAFAGLAMLTKGAIGLVLPAGAAFIYLAWQRRLGWILRPSRLVPGAVVLLGVGLSWYVALGLTRPDGFAFTQELFLEHHVGRFLDAKEGHGGPIVYYVPVVLVGFLPWSPFLGIAFAGAGLRGFETERRRLLKLFAIFAAFTFVFFSLAATKLPNYVGPVFPALALLVADGFERHRAARARGRARGRAWTWAIQLTVGSFALLGVVFALGPWIVSQLPQWLGEKRLKGFHPLRSLDLGPFPYAAAAVFAAGAVAIWMARIRRPERVVGVVAATFAVVLTLVTTTMLRTFDRQVSGPLRAAARRADAELPAGERIVLVSLRRKPSVGFDTGRLVHSLRRGDRDELAELFAEPGRVGIVSEDDLDRLDGLFDHEVIGRYDGYVVFRST